MYNLVLIWLILRAQQFSFSIQIQYVLIITMFTKSKEVKLLYKEQTYLSSYNNIVFWLLTIIIFHVGYTNQHCILLHHEEDCSKLKMNYLPIKYEIFGHSFHLF